MEIPIYQIDAFTSRVFGGNPAAVCPVREWLDDSALQNIAAENNLSETAFFVPIEDGYHIRWFTPVAEVDLCGHATLASAFIVFTQLDRSLTQVVFRSRSGILTVTKDGDLLSMDFPSQPPRPCKAPGDLLDGLKQKPLDVLCSEDYFVVFSNEKDILGLEPDMTKLKRVELRGVIVTARGDDADFVSRFFAPKFGIAEDPVTGSAHCALIPYWAEKLNKQELKAHQVSRRGGELFCSNRADRVNIAGRAVKYLEGVITF
jgi:PhzF family phenazine biosynthesis protein